MPSIYSRFSSPEGCVELKKKKLAQGSYEWPGLESNPRNSDPEFETLPTGPTALVLRHAILLLGPGLSSCTHAYRIYWHLWGCISKRVCSTVGVHKRSTFHVGAPQSSFVGRRWLGIQVICLVDLSSDLLYTMGRSGHVHGCESFAARFVQWISTLNIFNCPFRSIVYGRANSFHIMHG